MSSVLAILTYRRPGVLDLFLKSILASAPGYKIAVFEDCANIDTAADVLTAGGTHTGVDVELCADVWEHKTHTVYMGRRNMGVTGNSNRAMRWFMRQAEATHLCLCNDDLLARGDFVKKYADAHAYFGVGLWCFCDFESEIYKGVEVRVKGRPVKLQPRMTGIMMSMTRALIDKIGYFDTSFGKFGEEHCDFTNRARFSGFQQLNGQTQHCLDIPCPELVHQDVLSSIMSFEKTALDGEANTAMTAAAARYWYTNYYRPFRLSHGKMAAGYDGGGIPVADLERLGYELVVDYEYNDPSCTP